MGASKIELVPFHRGAEADLFLSEADRWKAVVKRRVKKEYRNDSLDDQIRRDRTVSEVNILHDAKAAGVKVPSILGIEPEANTFLMTFIEGTVARDCLDAMSKKDASRLFKNLGRMIGSLHSAGIVHGDLTTSNVLVTPSGDPFIVDFGMSRRSTEPEDRGVDLHLLQRSITASHVNDTTPLIKALSVGYQETAGKKIHESSWAKAREISRRGRYFAIR
jgi:TP53 regulating kinase and related kinases